MLAKERRPSTWSISMMDFETRSMGVAVSRRREVTLRSPSPPVALDQVRSPNTGT